MLGILQKREKLFVLILAELVSVLAMVFLSIYLLRMQAVGQDSYKSATELRYESYLLADQLRQSSDDLTRMVRSYAVSGNSQFEQYFWDILSIRDGKKNRPNYYERVYWDFMTVANPEPPFDDGNKAPLEELMRLAGFTPNEFQLLSQAQRNSDDLVHLEQVAMNAMIGKFQDSDGQFNIQKKPDPIFAQNLLFGDKYHEAKKNIMKPINEFLEAIDKRTGENVHDAASLVIFYHTALGVVFSVLIATGILLFFTLQRYQKLVLTNLKSAIRDQQEELRERKRVESELEEKNEQLKYLSRIDGLTGIFNRRHFNNLLKKEYARHLRNKKTLSLLLIDVDYFKKYNDYYGHIMGDECLIKITKLISESILRPADAVARFGGEEFVCILPETSLEGAIKVANKIMLHIREYGIAHDGTEKGYVTVSIGAACSEDLPRGTEHDLLSKADELLYLAKSLGRDRVAYF